MNNSIALLLSGYEDARRKSSDASGHVENNKLNKSIYALLNVCQALSTNESRVPFRESKLTRILQDSLRGTSKVLLVSCLVRDSDFLFKYIFYIFILQFVIKF